VTEYQPSAAGSAGDTLVVASHLRGSADGALRLGVRRLTVGSPQPLRNSLRITKGPAGEAVIAWDPESSTASYDVIRGDVSGMGLLSDRVDLGTVVCVADDTAAASAADPAEPVPGSAFFWLVRTGGSRLVRPCRKGPGARSGVRRLPVKGDLFTDVLFVYRASIGFDKNSSSASRQLRSSWQSSTSS
jgi:hypothetical protein